MRALVADPSATPALVPADVPEPTPAAGELLVRLEAASINRGEVRRAALQPPGTVIGWDVAGTVAGLGEGVTGFREGQRVLALSGAGGGFAELATVPAEWATPLPEGTDPVQVATLPVAGLTATNILRVAGVKAGDRVLVTGGAGGVGLFAIQLAAGLGATVTAQVGSERRGEAARAAGAGAVLVHPGDGSPFDGEYDVVLDGIGGVTLKPLLQTLAPHGHLVQFGNSAGGDSTIAVEDFYRKSATIHGFMLFVTVQPQQGREDLADLVRRVNAGTLTTTVQATAPLGDALGLLRDLIDRKVTGKVVLTG